MLANNLTISVPIHNEVCDKNCEYCVLKMTGYMKHNRALMQRNIPKAQTLAKAARITNVLITSKGEPLLNFHETLGLIDQFGDWPVELQTNGIWLDKNVSALIELHRAGLDVIAISIDRISEIKKFDSIFHAINEMSMTVRLCVNLTSKLSEKAINFNDIITLCQSHPIKQVIIRNIMVPNFLVTTEKAKDTKDWIERNTSVQRYNEWNSQMINTLSGNVFHAEDNHLIRKIPHGAKSYRCKGISVMFSDYCVQEANNTEDVRSLIFLEDGHMYTSWDKEASILF